ncbi:hypothetical protein GALMADRAFT_241688 [Galerina marginata CBS 339.88]|uniref:F-box domain-containing protein n=1 Tax=Galerina marginata (strain CBS 339.88) TaxID=685588 RepID=A0A067TCZ3_GALM3|nr:hypothetical protein GALMADRAFT_241688 [Galerina marginata CBS 339.88]
MPEIPCFPQELVDRIIDEFGSEFPLDAESRRTLFSCAVVCRSFLPHSQKLLWTDIRVINGTPAAKNVLAKLESSPTLFRHLRALRLGFNKETRDVGGFQALLNLVKVHGVDIQHLGVCYDDEDANCSLSFPVESPFLLSLASLGASSNLTTLHLKYLSIPMIHLSKFLNLKSLKLERCDFQHPQDDPALLGLNTPLPVKPLLPSLEDLHLIRCLEQFGEIFYFYGPVKLGNVKTLRSVCRDRTDFRLVAGFLNTVEVCDALESLDFEEENMFCVFNPAFRDRLDFTALKNLRHLKLKSIMGNPFGQFNTSPACGILNSSMMRLPTSLQTIEIVIDTPFWDDAPEAQLLDFLHRDSNWTNLDANLTNPSLYPSLHAVNFLLCLRPPGQGDKILTLEGAQQQLAPALQFPILESSPSIAFNVDIVLGVPLGM